MLTADLVIGRFLKCREEELFLVFKEASTELSSLNIKISLIKESSYSLCAKLGMSSTNTSNDVNISRLKLSKSPISDLIDKNSSKSLNPPGSLANYESRDLVSLLDCSDRKPFRNNLNANSLQHHGIPLPTSSL